MIVLASDYVGLKTLEHLVEHGYRVDAIVTDPADRGGFNSRIRDVAENAGQGAIYETKDLKSPEVLARLESSGPELGILAWWPRLLKGEIRKVPRMGWLNFHPSLLPYNRGRNPNFWALADDTPCGVTLHFIDDGIDSGPIVAQAQIEVGWTDTGFTLYEKSREAILDLFRRNIDAILAGKVVPVLQDLAQGVEHREGDMIEASTVDIDAPTTGRRLLNLARAKMFAPHPPVRFRDAGRTYTVSVVIEEEPMDG
jgi:Methionyl-tRNA formyltransferase